MLSVAESDAGVKDAVKEWLFAIFGLASTPMSRRLATQFKRGQSALSATDLRLPLLEVISLDMVIVCGCGLYTHQ